MLFHSPGRYSIFPIEFFWQMTVGKINILKNKISLPLVGFEPQSSGF